MTDSTAYTSADRDARLGWWEGLLFGLALGLLAGVVLMTWAG